MQTRSLPMVAVLLLVFALKSMGHDTGSGADMHAGPENTNSPARTPRANIRFVGQLDPFPGNNMYTEVSAEGNYAYVGSLEHEDFAIIDISDAVNPRLGGTYHGGTNGYVGDIHVQNGIAYVACEAKDTNKPGGVYIVDVSDPAKLELLSQITAAEKGYDRVHTLFLDRRFLYLADFRTPVVKVFDVNTPSAPVFIRDIGTTDQYIHDTTVISNRLYTSGWNGNTDIYDVTDIGTRAPVRLGTISTGTTSHSSWVNEDGTILATCSEVNPREVRLYNITDPSRAVRLSTITSQSAGVDGQTPHNPVIVGDLIFVSWYQAGLQVFNIRDPAKPLLAGSFDTFPGGISTPGPLLADQGNWKGDGCWGVYPLAGLNKVLLSDIDGGLFIVDASRLGGADADADRIPDAWEAKHSLSGASIDDALFDPDGDGINNLNEFLAGTDPSKHDIAARITGIERSGREVRLNIWAEDGRLYCLERNTALTKTGWTLVQDEVQCTNGIGRAIHTNAVASRMFYRVRLRP